MNTVQLNAKENTRKPTCLSYDDFATVAAFEVEMRKYRALTTDFQITQIDQGVFGTYEVVSGETSKLYFVDLVDNSKKWDTCTCRDYLTNGLGTCKHVQATYVALPKLGLDTKYTITKTFSPTISIYPGGNEKLKMIGSWTRELYKECGIKTHLLKDKIILISDINLDKVNESKVKICQAVKLLVQKHNQKTNDLTRSKLIQDKFDKNKIDINVTSSPLYQYQIDCMKQMVVQGRALLALTMGSGKSISAIAACEVLHKTDNARTVLCIVPASLKYQWSKEIEKFAPRKTDIIYKSDDITSFDPNIKEIQYKIINYELVLRNADEIAALNPDIIILDEAQKIKNFRTKSAEAISDIPRRFLFALTGTPVENKLDDLYSIMQLVNGDVLGPLWFFNYKYHNQDPEAHGKVTGCKNLGELRKQIKPYVFSRSKQEVLSQLPPLTEEMRFIPMTAVQADLEEEYRMAAAKILARCAHRGMTLVESQILAGHLLKARQACDCARLCDPTIPSDDPTPKLEELEQIVSEVCIQNQDKLIVFSEWVEMLNIIAEMLNGMNVGYVMLTGSIPNKKRPKIIESFKEENDKYVLLSSDAGGLGLNLQFAHSIVHFDLPWNPAKLDQRTARAHRLGQTDNVCVVSLCSESGIERGIKDVLESKREIRVASLDQNSAIEEVELQSFVQFLKQNTAMLKLEQDKPVDNVAKPAVAVVVEPKTENPFIKMIIQKMKEYKELLKNNDYLKILTISHELILSLVILLNNLDQTMKYNDLVKIMVKRLIPGNMAYMPIHTTLISLHYFVVLKTGGVTPMYIQTMVTRTKKTIDSLLDMLP